MTKIAGSISQRHGSADSDPDPDPPQNVMDPQDWSQQKKKSSYLHWRGYYPLQGGKRVGVVGLGGLGQTGVALAAAMGNTVTAISSSPSKEESAR